MVVNNRSDRTSDYLQYLPGILQAEPSMNRLLLAFERILTGLPNDPDHPDPLPQQPGLEAYIDRIYTYFDPHPVQSGETSEDLQAQRTPDEFLPWLASWVALSLRDDWEPEVKRRFISQMVSLYRQRGTKAGLKRLLELYTNEEVEIYEFAHVPHYFQVQMTLSAGNPELLRKKEEIARAILNQEKPAHTFYSLQILVPSMQIVNDPEVTDWTPTFREDGTLEVNNNSSQVGLILGANTILGTK